MPAGEMARTLPSFKRPLLSVDVTVSKASNEILSNRSNFMHPIRAIFFLFMLTSWKVPNFCRSAVESPATARHRVTRFLRSHRRRLSAFIGVYREAVQIPDEHRIWVYLFISWCSVDLEEILQDNRRRTPMNADFIPDKLWSIAIRRSRPISSRYRILTPMNYDTYTDKHRRSRFSDTINYDKHRYIRMNQGKLGFWSTYQDFGADFES